MEDPTALALPIALAVFAICLIIFLTPRILSARGGRVSMRKTIEMPCPICQRDLTIPPEKLSDIEGPEVALIVREDPGVQGVPLADYRCPDCEALHIFRKDTNPARWLMANPFEAQSVTGRCQNCRKPLRRPEFAQGTYDGRLTETTDLKSDHGVYCSRCASVCCLDCCRDSTRNRTPDGSLLCPRCFRGPLEKVYHF